MVHTLCSYNQWDHCLRLANTEIELIITLDVGPRIIRFGFIEDRNEFQEYPEHVALRNDGNYHSYGGHRLWVAPEVEGWTNHPDNNPVSWTLDANLLTCTAQPETRTKLQKSITLSIDSTRNRVQVIHTITNVGEYERVLAPWAITVMAPGGRAIIPQEPFIPHPQRVLPVRPLVLWSYTDMQDKRWTWGSRFIQLRQDTTLHAPQKVGARISQGWAAYYNNGHLFLKLFPCFADAQYPDFGCNAELFTNHRMLEVESLGPLVALKPQATVSHTETWYLWKDVVLGTTDTEIEATFANILPLTKI
ncbi:MAG: DUF4380 domain-containing protein [Bacteroidetes bacterium]|nr:DUF4380 domain-containing protein [Bacteroidota bacterium]